MKNFFKKNKLILILVFSFLIRLISLNQSFWLDEATTATVSGMSFTKIINEFLVNDFHPPLYYFFTKLWGGVFGVNEISLRLLSVLFGVGTVYFVYKIGERFIGKNVGVISSLFLATSGLFIYYSQEARAYVVSAFFVSLLAYLFLNLLEKPTKKLWVAFSIVLALNSLTDYLPNLIIPVFWIFALVQKKKGEWMRTFVFSHFPLALIWAWWLPFFLRQLGSGLAVKTSGALWWGILGKTNLKELMLIPVKFTLGRISFVNKKVYGGILLIIFSTYAFFLSYIVRLKKTNKMVSFMALWLLIPIILSALLGFVLSVFSYFRLIFVLPAFFILLGYLVGNLKGKVFWFGMVFVLSVNILSSSMYLFNNKFQREDWRGMERYVSINSPKNSLVLFVSSGQQEAYKYYETKIPSSGPDKLDESFDKVWFVRYVVDIFDPQEKVLGKLEDLGYVKISERDFNGVLVWEYEKI